MLFDRFLKDRRLKLLYVPVFLFGIGISIGVSFFNSSSTYATSHYVNGIRYAIPFKNITPNTMGTYNGLLPGFEAAFSEDAGLTANDYDFLLFQTENNKCTYVGSYLASVRSSQAVARRFPYALPSDDVDVCITLSPFGSGKVVDVDSIPNNPFTDWLQFGYQSQRDYYIQALDPYWFLSTGFYTGKTYTDRVGRDYYDLFTVITGRYTSDNEDLIDNSLSYLNIPIYNNLLDDDCIPVSEGDYLYFDVEFLLSDDAYTESDSIFDDNNSFIGIRSDYYYTTGTGGGGVQTYYDSCQPTLSDVVVNGYENRKRLTFENCKVRIRNDISDEYDSLQLYLTWRYVDSNNEFVPYLHTSKLEFYTTIIRDNDGNDGFGCSVGDDLVGNGVLGAPSPYDDGGDNWYRQLTNLFSFQFINPFLPMYNLFTNPNDSRSCASIPIIAGMLHTNEDTICPWFPVSVRRVVTPVLSLFSLMILVGFIYHWLGSSSGNLFSDSAEENITFTRNGVKRTKKGKD